MGRVIHSINSQRTNSTAQMFRGADVRSTDTLGTLAEKPRGDSVNPTSAALADRAYFLGHIDWLGLGQSTPARWHHVGWRRLVGQR